jgi:cyclophilin family peptidyl-prolyl cis-trans isomerase
VQYRIRLNGEAIKDENGLALDGEFKAGKASGDGFAGGNYDVVSNGARKTTARFSTVSGYINMRLFGKTAPITAANFLHYANEGAWDTTFFHRSIPGFVIQGGGFNVSASDQLGQVHQETAIQNEFGLSNLRGTVAMARAVDGDESTTTDQNSATNQFFFNLSNSNAANLDHQEGGFTVFGQVLDDGSLQVMDAIATRPRINASSITSAFDNLPVRDAQALSSRALDPKGDLILITRVAMLMDPSATPNVQSSIKRSITPAATSAAVSAAPLFAVKKIESDQGDSVLA